MAATFNNVLASRRDDTVVLAEPESSSKISLERITKSIGGCAGNIGNNTKYQLYIIIFLSILSSILLLLLLFTPTSNWNTCTDLRSSALRVEVDSQQDPGRCGGRVAISGQRELVYERKYENGTEPKDEICIWLLHTQNGGGILFSLLNSSEVQFNGDDSRMVVSHAFTSNNSFLNVVELVGTSKVYDSPFIVLWFHSKPSSGKNVGFHVKLSEKNVGVFSKAKYNFDMVEYSETSPRFVTYPSPPARSYPGNTRIFFWIKPITGKEIKLGFDSVDVEPGHDGLQTFRFEIATKRVLYITGSKLSGHLGKLTGTFYAGANQPFLIYFHSDGSEGGNGFTFNYAYI